MYANPNSYQWSNCYRCQEESRNSTGGSYIASWVHCDVCGRTLKEVCKHGVTLFECKCDHSS